MKAKDFKPSRLEMMTDRTPCETSWQWLVNFIKSEALKNSTDVYRQRLAELDAATTPEERKALKDQLSEIKRRTGGFFPHAVLRGGRTEQYVVELSNHVMVDLDKIPLERFADVRQRLRDWEYTFLLYTTYSGRGLRVIVRVDGEYGVKQFRRVWSMVNDMVEEVCGVKADRQCGDVTRFSGLAYDPEIYYNGTSKLFTVNTSNGISSNTPNYTNLTNYKVTFDDIVNRVKRMVEANGCWYCEGHHNEYIANCMYLMNKFGVSEEEALRWGLSEFSDYDRRSVRSTVRSCYRHTSEHGSLACSEEWATRRQSSSKSNNPSLHTPHSSLSEASRSRKAQVPELESFLDGYMETRYNLFSNAVEVRIDDKDWERLTDRIENTIWMRMHEAGIKADVMQIHQLLGSEYVKEFHPLRDYLDRLPPWDGKTDHIGRLAGMVRVREEQQLFVDAFRRWLVAMIAGVLRTDIVNQTILVLIGRQGCYKTSFAQNILPPQLQRYYTMKANSQRITKDDLFTMTEYMIVNLEEIDTMPAAELNQLKAMVTQTFIDERVPYGRNKDHRAHICSFFATGNNEQFLTDETGNRRWLPFKVESIDNPWTAQIPHDKIYAQAYALYKGDFKYWFDDSEVQQLRRHVTTFETPRAEVEMILTHYRKPQDLERYSFVTSSQIVARFGTASLRLSSVKVGKAMKELGFDMVKRSDSRYWKVVERSADEVNFSLPDDKTDNDPPF